MTRAFTCWWPVAALALGILAIPPYAHAGAQLQPSTVARISTAPQADLPGVVRDENGQPLEGAVVSVLGSTTAFAVSDREGRFVFRSLPPGPYLLRAHLEGYLPPRARIIQVDRSLGGPSTIELTRRVSADQAAPVLAASVGTGGADSDTTGDAGDPETHDHGEVAWRLRHLKRSVLKDATAAPVDLVKDDSFLDSPFDQVTRAVGTSTRLAAALLADLPLSGQVNFLTSASFDRPQDLFSADTGLPRGVAFVSLQAPTDHGQWTMRGATTQGDLASWILAGSYVQNAVGARRYEAGLSYGMQRYFGGNGDALAAVSDGGRNVGAVYVYDEWTVNSVLRVHYGAKYARYDYLTDAGLFSPRTTVTITPSTSDTFRLRATVSRRAVAPGAEEFIPPPTGLWLPPERTFSPVSGRSGFTPEHVDHFEVAAEREWFGASLIGVRVFRQKVEDQLVTLFGVAPQGTAGAGLGHYYVASGGDVHTRGWGLGVSRSMSGGLRASVDYTHTDASWVRRSPDTAMLSRLAASVLRDEERIHDVTTSVESVVPVTATRVFVIYKINTRFADTMASDGGVGSRFDVQLIQSLPFLGRAGAQWEMLVGVRNMFFREEQIDASAYDELLVLRAPTRVVGGVTVRF